MSENIRLQLDSRRSSFCSRLAALVFAVVVIQAAYPAAAHGVTGVSPSLKRYPYASEVVSNSATINWATDRSQTTGSATWGTVSGGTCTPSNRVAATKVAITVGSTSEYQWSASLVFPGPGTYCYRTQLGSIDLVGSNPSLQLKTAASPGSSFSFAVVGDFGGASTGEAGVMTQIGKSPASFVVSTGDTDNAGGSDTDYGDLNQGNVFPSAYLPMIGNRPIFAAQGNHGFTNNLPYLHNFPAPLAARASGGRNLQESYCCISTMSASQNYASSWYAFNWGSARFYVLEASWADGQGGYQGDFLAHWNGPVSGCGPCGAQLAWLKSDLAAHATTPLKFAFFHYPLHADSSSQGSDPYLIGASRLEGLLANNNVDVVFNGHAHIYERNFPQIAGKPMVNYVTGAGGATLGSVSGCSAFDAYAIGSNSSCRAPKPTSNSHVYEYLLVTVNGSQVTVTPTDSTGLAFDRQTYSFGTTPPPSSDFSISASPSSLSVVQGSVGTSTISTAVTSGTAQTIALSATGAPSGTTVSFNPQTVTAGQTSKMTITTSTATALGSSTVTVTGTGSAVKHSAPVTLTVTTASSAPVLVQSAGATESASSTALTGTFPAPTVNGHLLVLSASVYSGATNPITSITDSGGNAWKRVGSYFVSGHYSDGEMWYAANARPVKSVTAHTASAATVSFAMQEYAAINPLNPLESATGTSNTGTTASSGTITSPQANDLVVGFVAGHGNAQTMTVTSPGFTVLAQRTSTGTIASVTAGYAVAATPGAQTFSARFGTAMYWAAGIAVFGQ